MQVDVASVGSRVEPNFRDLVDTQRVVQISPSARRERRDDLAHQLRKRSTSRAIPINRSAFADIIIGERRSASGAKLRCALKLIFDGRAIVVMPAKRDDPSAKTGSLSRIPRLGRG